MKLKRTMFRSFGHLGRCTVISTFMMTQFVLLDCAASFSSFRVSDMTRASESHGSTSESRNERREAVAKKDTCKFNWSLT